MGLQFAKALEPYGLYFLEEPCWPESVDGLAAINRAVSTPIASSARARRPASAGSVWRGGTFVLVYDDQGRPFTVKYHEMAPMLLNEYQKQQREYQRQQRSIEAQAEVVRALDLAGHQVLFWHEQNGPADLLVIGAGPAGLAAAVIEACAVCPVLASPAPSTTGRRRRCATSTSFPRAGPLTRCRAFSVPR